jgi:hypothetical protein
VLERRLRHGFGGRGSAFHLVDGVDDDLLDDAAGDRSVGAAGGRECARYGRVVHGAGS